MCRTDTGSDLILRTIGAKVHVSGLAGVGWNVFLGDVIC